MTEGLLIAITTKDTDMTQNMTGMSDHIMILIHQGTGPLLAHLGMIDTDFRDDRHSFRDFADFSHHPAIIAVIIHLDLVHLIRTPALIFPHMNLIINIQLINPIWPTHMILFNPHPYQY